MLRDEIAKIFVNYLGDDRDLIESKESRGDI